MTNELVDVRLNGIEVKRVKNAIFIPLPAELWRGPNGPCICGKCDGSGYWDTLAVMVNPDGGRDTTWTVHYPELQRSR